MKRTRTAAAGKRAVAAGMVLLVAGSLSGCFLLDPNWKQERQDNLDGAVAEFEAMTVGEVICEGAGGEPTPKNGYTHYFVFAGADIPAAVGARLEMLEYTGFTRPDSLSYTRPDGIAAVGYVMDDSDEAGRIEVWLAEDGCEFPSTDAMWVEFQESP
ncbi:hypothetical protein [Salinibacterium sp. SWN248]|uniref:hypothetical protein n=1 Tax=Salinibacterium sp. SWN248 TaxID=2792056 RepID=UPI0018CFBF1C|nr:hypothetical protein [Salinibacterium sp. SWN248]MBH0023047.1 hypothetical protein [Salinibacterium sp. SWN248]